MGIKQRARSIDVSGARCSEGDPLFAERYRAIDARDVRFDGQFFTAVSSTGIYCRPSCPARTPKAPNVTFYSTSAAAHEAGFRACKRCLPEAAPGTPEWNLRRDVTGRAMKLIADGTVDREGVNGLAARLGYTPRHIHRMLIAELGAGPRPLARARRAQAARALLTGSDLPLAQVAFAAGFGSIRQFNATVKEVFAVRPSDLRSQSRRDPAGSVPVDSHDTARRSAPVHLEVDLPVRHPFDAVGLFRFLATRAIPGVEAADLTRNDRLRYARTLTLPHGPAAIEVLAIPGVGSTWRLRGLLELTSLADVAPAIARIRRLLDLDADPVAIDTALSPDPALAPLVTRVPGIRVPGTVDPHELVIRALMGQQITVAAARTHLGRLATRAGTPYPSKIDGLSLVFPTPGQIVAAVPSPHSGEVLDPERILRLLRQRIRAIHDAAQALEDGTLVVHMAADADILRTSLLARPGIGAWTASYIVMRVLGEPDAWLDGDTAIIAGGRSAGLLDENAARGMTDHTALARSATAWAPWRSYAAMHLWQAAIVTTTTQGNR